MAVTPETVTPERVMLGWARPPPQGRDPWHGPAHSKEERAAPGTEQRQGYRVLGVATGKSGYLGKGTCNSSSSAGWKRGSGSQDALLIYTSQGSLVLL